MLHGLQQVIWQLCHSEQLASHPTLYAFIEKSLEKSPVLPVLHLKGCSV